MNSLEERLKAGLTAEAQAWSDPPAPSAIRAASRPSRRGIGLMAVAAVLVIVGGVAIASRTTSADTEVRQPVGQASTATSAGIVVEHPLTLSDGTEVVVSMPVAEGSNFEVVWGAGLVGGASKEPYANALVHIWLDRSADEVIAEIEEVERLSGSEPVPNRYIVDHDGHAYDFQFGDYSDPPLPPETLGLWLSSIVVEDRPDSALPLVVISDDLEVNYGPTYGISGTYVNGEPVTIGLTEGCENGVGAPIEYANDRRASVESCELDGHVEVLIAGSPEYVEDTRTLDVVRLAPGS